MSFSSWDEIAAAVTALGGAPTRADFGLAIEAEGGFRATVRALAPPEAATAFRPLSVLRAECVVPRARVAGLAEAGAAARAAPALNRHAGATAAMADDAGNLRFTARVTLYDGDEAFRPIHSVLIAYAAVWGATTALAGAERVARRIAPNLSGASLWTPDEFEEARGQLPVHLQPMLDPPSPHVLAGSVPLAGGAPARIAVRADVQHPLHGPGLFALLELPVRFPDVSALAATLAALNTTEAQPIDGPPHFGAWAPAAEARIAYTCFLPNGVRVPVIAALFDWFARRAVIAAGVLRVG
jgi:hypothetical protein